MVQLEVEVQDVWRPVIRYDTAHGFVHVDRFSLQRKLAKERLSLAYAEALTRAERDIKQNWAVYRQKFLGGEAL